MSKRTTRENLRFAFVLACIPLACFLSGVLAGIRGHTQGALYVDAVLVEAFAASVVFIAVILENRSGR